MSPYEASRFCCCVCGKKKQTHPGLKLHLFPKDAKRRLEWLQSLNIAYVKSSQSICEEHFESKFVSSTGRLLKNAVPLPADGCGEAASKGDSASVTEELASSDHSLPEFDASEKYEMDSSCSEDIIIKEECVVDQDYKDDISLTLYSPLEISPAEFSEETKVEIHEQSELEQGVRERVEPKSHENDPKNDLTSPAESNAVECISPLPVQREAVCHESPVCSLSSSPTPLCTPNNSASVLQESSPYQSKPSHSGSTGLRADTVTMNKDLLLDKSKADIECTVEKRKNECGEDCECDTCSTLQVKKRKADAMKSVMDHTYSGPRQHKVMSNNSSIKRIMIVNKVSLKNLQAKGMITASTKKYWVNLQSVKKRIVTCVPAGADGPLKNGQIGFSQSGNPPLGKTDSSLKALSVQVPSGNNANCVIGLRKESSNISYTSSHSTGIPASQTTVDSQAPGSVSRIPADSSKASSLTFVGALPAEVSKDAGISHDTLPITPPVFNNDVCTRNEHNSQVTASSGSQSSSSCSSRTTGSTSNASTAPRAYKHPHPKPTSVTIRDLSCEASSEERGLSRQSPEEKREGDHPTKTRLKNSDTVQGIDLPSAPVHQPHPLSSGSPQQIQQVGLMSNTASSEQSSAGSKIHPKGHAELRPARSANKRFKIRCARLLNKHRQRYYLLSKKYKRLQEEFSAVEDVGTPQQVMTDARKFLSEESALFLESQMFLRSRQGRSNRFSRKFMKLMMEYYNRSSAGYRFLRTIFTLPTVQTVQVWMNKSPELSDLDEDTFEHSKGDFETGNEGDHSLPKMKPADICHDSYSNRNFLPANRSAQNFESEDNSVDNYDSE